MMYCDPYAQSPDWLYQLKDFHKKIISTLEKVERGEIKKLMINVPAQHWKSTISSVGYPAWTLGRNPYQHIWLISYSSELSEGFSRKTREMLRDPVYQSLFGDILSKDSQWVSEWATNKWGTYTAVGIWGSYTGKPATKIIIDDPHKDQAEAQSPLLRQKVRDWYTSVATTRITSMTSVIIIMTRWHEDDLCWRLLEAEPDERTVLNIPVFNEDWTVIRPERHPIELINNKRQIQWEAMFQAMYMGNPVNEWGWDFKTEYFQYYDKWEIRDQYWINYTRDLQVMTFIDPAISQKQTADNTAIVTVWLDKKNNNVYILDITAGKFLPDDIINKVFQIVNQYRPQKVGIETNQFQKMLDIEIRKEMRKRNNFFILEWQTSSMNKEAKIKTVLQHRYANASIIHQKRWQNIPELEWQLLKFPNGKHDDIIDSLSMAIMMLSSVSINGKKQKVVKAKRL
jgi:predicted phage terminase large subunit-like protein